MSNPEFLARIKYGLKIKWVFTVMAISTETLVVIF